jgi:hypothetical protein
VSRLQRKGFLVKEMGERSLYYLSKERSEVIAVCLEISSRKLLRPLLHESVVSQ